MGGFPAYSMPGMPNYPYMTPMAQGGRMIRPNQMGGPMGYGQPGMTRPGQPFPMRPTLQMGPRPGMPSARPGMPPQYMQMPGMMGQQPRMMMPNQAPPNQQQNYNNQVNFKYNQQVRNAPGDMMMQQQQQQQQQQMQQQQQQQQSLQNDNNELTAEGLASAPPAE